MGEESIFARDNKCPPTFVDSQRHFQGGAIGGGLGVNLLIEYNIWLMNLASLRSVGSVLVAGTSVQFFLKEQQKIDHKIVNGKFYEELNRPLYVGRITCHVHVVIFILIGKGCTSTE